MQDPHHRWEGFRGDPWVSDSPELERARGQEPVDKAGNGAKALRPLLGETRVTWRKLYCLKSNAIRSILGLWLQRLTARWTLRTGKRRDGATSEGPAPRNERGQGISGPPTSRSDVLCGGTAGWPTGRE